MEMGTKQVCRDRRMLTFSCVSARRFDQLGVAKRPQEPGRLRWVRSENRFFQTSTKARRYSSDASGHGLP